MPSVYAGLGWDNFRVLDGANSVASGYLNGVISPNNVIYNVNGDPAQITNAAPFNLISTYAIAAWNDGLALQVQGFIGTTQVYDTSYTLNTSGPLLLTLNYYWVTAVKFISSGGTHHSGYIGTGAHIALDNVVVDLVPAQVSTPNITNITRTADSVLISGNNGPANRVYYVIATTDISLPEAQWPPIATNRFDPSGYFSATNSMDTSVPQYFFKLAVP